CSNYYSDLICSQSAPGLLKLEATTTYSCTYDAMSSAGSPPAVPVCDLTCPTASQMIAYLPDFGSQLYLTSAHFDSASWTGKQTSSPDVVLGPTVQFGCVGEPRCGPYIDGDGVQHVTRCNLMDLAATCSEDKTAPMCTCTAGFTGPTCSILINFLIKIVRWRGDSTSD
ncbi:hypothetical protein PFISCL1PPCAC_27012, partial [Pristionchus fissidentatus]